jgi:apolipoprotein N-acyltransferase
MILSSNDSWFYDSVGVYMHQAQAQLRAVECGRDIARAAGTGISSVIDEHGRILAWIDPLTEGYAVADVRITTTLTPYTVVGNLLVWLCMAFALLCLVFGRTWACRPRREVVLRCRYGRGQSHEE